MMDTIDNERFLPSLATSAWELARRTRKRRMILVALRLSLVTLAAVFGALTIAGKYTHGKYTNQPLDYAGVAGVLAFIGVLGVRLAMQGDPDFEVAEPRASAMGDVIASHAWRFAVGARGYAVGSPELDYVASQQFSANIDPFKLVLAKYSTSAKVSRQITEEMSRVRSCGLSERRNIYISARIEPLQSAASSDGLRLGRRWRILITVVLLVELLGIPGGVLKAIELSRIDLLGVTAAAAASIALWIDTLNFQERRRVATNLGKNLASAYDMLVLVRTEDEWADIVAKIEEQLSLESEALLSSDATPQWAESQIEDSHTMSPDEYFAAAATLKRQIWDESTVLPKLEPDVIVAVNPGGAILGGILYFMTRAGDFLPLSLRAGVGDEDLAKMLNAAPWPARKPDHLSILLVDASIKSGDSLKKAIALVKQTLASKGFVPEGTASSEGARMYVLRTAVIARQPDPDHGEPVQVDYFVNETTKRFPYGNI